MAVYGRMFLTIGMGLVGVRLLMDHIGDSNFGLLSALVATGAILNLLQSSLVASCRRFLGVSIGAGDVDETISVFNATLTVFLIAGAILGVIGFSLTPVVIGGLTIPEDRLDESRLCYWVGITNL